MARGQIWQKFPKVLRFMALFPPLKFSVAHPDLGKRSTENFTEISCQISRHLWQRKTEKYFISALLQGSCSDKTCQFLYMSFEVVFKAPAKNTHTYTLYSERLPKEPFKFFSLGLFFCPGVFFPKSLSGNYATSRWATRNYALCWKLHLRNGTSWRPFFRNVSAPLVHMIFLEK